MLTDYSFLLQALVWVAPILGSYAAYREVRAPQKQESARRDLVRLGMSDRQGDLEAALSREYRPRDYFWPLFYASAVTVVFYSMTHPSVVQTGLWTGVLEDRVAIFGPDASAMDHTLLVARMLFWGWIGAYIYAFNIIWRRFMSYDLTPSVYIFVATRMALAFVFGGTMVLAVSLAPAAAIGDYNTQMIITSLIAFFVGFFPERGLDWIAATVKRFTGDNSRLSNETRLSRLEGLSVWHQGRLKQQDIENVQNLATADIPLLVIATPFGVAQIIDWVDQAILLMHANDDAYMAVDNSGIRCASDFVFATRNEEGLQLLARGSEVGEERLRLLRMSMESASNLQLVAYYRWRASIDPERIAMAEAILERRPRQLQALETTEVRILEEYRQRNAQERTLTQQVPPSQTVPDAN